MKTNVKAIDLYHYMGALSHKDVRYLQNLKSDSQRRRTVFNWYGREGAKYAWVIYQNWRIKNDRRL